MSSNREEITKLFKDNPDLKQYYDDLMLELKAEQDIYRMIEDYNKDYLIKPISSSPDQIDDDSEEVLTIDIDSLTWVDTIPKSKKTENYELCNDKTNPIYKELNVYIVTHRSGYLPVKYGKYNYSIIKTGIMRRKAK